MTNQSHKKETDNQAEVTVFDIADYILRKQGGMSAMKLQKLVYYSQVWSLVWDGESLFPNKIEAWANGPVSPCLYARHRGRYQLSEGTFKRDAKSLLSDSQKETVDLILEAYGDKSPQWLSDQTHAELPWQKARIGLSDTERSNKEILLSDMAEYYESL